MGERKLKLVPQGEEAAVKESHAIDSEFLAVPPEQILSRAHALSDLFVRLSSGRLVKVAHKDEKIDRERIERMAHKNVNELYVMRHDFSGVIQNLILHMRENATAPTDNDKSINEYFQVAQSVLTEVSKLPISDEAIGHAIEVTQELATRLNEVDDIAKGLKLILGLGEKHSRHAMGCVVVSNWLARAMRWSAPRVLQPLTLGAFMHDVGLKELPVELLNKERMHYSAEEVALYETHPTRGVMILRSFNAMPAEVLQIVQEHHEMPNGQGFPNHIRGERMFPLAKIVSFANLLSHEMLDAFLVHKSFSVEGMIERIDLIYKTMYGSEMHKAAKSIFKK
ncbi:MAG: HD-GYP domain-containing protein [Bdellovibrionales bacterium]